MRILTFTSLFPNSIDPAHGIFIFQRATHLGRLPGNNVEVISPVPYFPRYIKLARWRTAAALPSEERVGDLIVHHPRYFLLPKISMPVHALLMFLGSLPLALRMNAQAGFDCIDAHFVYPDGLAAVLLGKVLKVPVVVSARGTDINVYPSFRSIRPMIRWTLSQAHEIIAVSASLMEAMHALGASTYKTHVISNGVDGDRFERVDPVQARIQLGLQAGIPFIVSVGALIPAKGHEKLIKAFKQIVPRHPNLRLYILGEGPSRLNLTSLIQKLDLQDRIQLPGKRPNEELKSWFSASEVSCLVSEREGWPNVVTESLACGTPVVATRVGGIPEILHSEHLGVLVDQTLDAIALGLETALSRPWDRKAISEQTRKRTWSHVAREVEAVLARHIKRPEQDSSS